MFRVVSKPWGQFVFAICLIGITLIIPTSSIAQGAPPTWPPGPPPDRETGPPPHMAYQPPQDAERIEQFVPPGVELTRVTTEEGRESRTNLDVQRGNVISYNNDRIA
ncbi:MAG: hypothetical protein AAF490_00630, partial [Chloroflexota bacterium]